MIGRRIHIPTERREGRPYRDDEILYCGNRFVAFGYHYEQSDWANPDYRVAKNKKRRSQEQLYADHLAAKELFRDYLLRREDLLRRLPETDDQVLGCWCPLHLPCHVDAIIELRQKQTVDSWMCGLDEFLDEEEAG